MNEILLQSVLVPFAPIQAYVDKVQTTEIPLLEQRLVDSTTQFCFLVDFVTFSPLHMKRNTQTIQWLKRMPSIFKEHQKIITEKTEQFQSGLKVSVSTLYCIYLSIYHGLPRH